jgi:hypothetical protein
MQHGFQEVEIRGGNLLEEVARDGGKPVGQAAPGRLLTGLPGGVRQVEDLAPQPGVGGHQSEHELAVRTRRRCSIPMAATGGAVARAR